MSMRVLAMSMLVTHASGFIPTAPTSASRPTAGHLALSKHPLHQRSPRTSSHSLLLRMEQSNSARVPALKQRPAGVEADEAVLCRTKSDDEGILAPASTFSAIRTVFNRWSDTMSRKQATWLLVTLVAVSGFAFAVTKFVATAFESSTILCIRFLIATLVLSPWLKMDRKTFAAGLEPSMWLGLGYATQTLCMAGGTSAGVASFFASMSCVVCPFLEVLFAGVVLTARSWVAAGLAVSGAGFLCLWDGLPRIADMVGLLQAAFFGMHLFRVEKVLRENPGKEMEITVIQLLCISLAALGFGAFSAVSAGAFPPAAEWVGLATAWVGGLGAKIPELLGLVWLGVFPSAMALSLMTVVVTKLSASRVALMFATEPLFAALVACTFLGETLGVNLLIGGALAVAACLARSKDTVLRKLGELLAATSGAKLKEKTA